VALELVGGLFAEELHAVAPLNERQALCDQTLKLDTDAEGEVSEREIPFLKGYTVFNAEQCDGLPAHYYGKAVSTALTPMQRLETADRFFAATGADIRHGGTRAYYAAGPDYVQMPPFETFRDAESYYATLAHETTHNADNRIMPRRTLRVPELGTFRRECSA
jgi:antirestriction protein ArdC